MVVLLPRRTAWTTAAELSFVFSRLFGSDGDRAAQQTALERISVWMVRGNCPHAVESTANLFEVVVKDSQPESSAGRSHTSQLQTRLAYSMALIRFVNSLVDPLQTTFYAKSMANLAAQLGLPLWFVELRHAATHEDLPPLAVLRDAARQALDYLYANYWLPALSPASSVALLPLDGLRALLRSYKTLAKTSLRDASKTASLKIDLHKIYRGMEGWMLEAESLGRGRDRALEGLAEAFVEEGGALVPMAKKKRPTTRAPELPAELLAVWMPLLDRMEDLYEGFQDVLIARMVELLCSVSQEAESAAAPGQGGAVDRSYALTITAWILHLLSLTDDSQVTDRVIKACLVAPNPSSLALLDALSASDDSLAQTIQPLVRVLRNTSAPTTLAPTLSDDNTLSALDQMERRMQALSAKVQRKQAVQASNGASEGGADGWGRVSSFRAAPIGALPEGGSKALDLKLLQSL